MEIAMLVFAAAKELITIGVEAYEAKKKTREELKAQVDAVFADLKAKIEALPAETAALNLEMDEALRKKFQPE